jgi:hypothetical protein
MSTAGFTQFRQEINAVARTWVGDLPQALIARAQAV